MNKELNKDELRRYSRHLLLSEMGVEGQEKLKAARVMVIGAGGLGSPALIYLAAAGIGTLGVIDHDIVDYSNLHRQILYGDASLGAYKVEMAKKRLEEINPLVSIETHRERLDAGNSLSILKDYDLVIDGSDNFPTRYLVNDSCVLLGIPCIYGSVYKFEGQVSVFNYKMDNGYFSPNYRDLYPLPPPPSLVPDCAEGGVLGVLPGIIGSYQAMEAIKVILRLGDVLAGRLLLFDAITAASKIIAYPKDPQNPLHQDSSPKFQLIDYEAFCKTGNTETQIKHVSIHELAKMKEEGGDYQLIDVREPHEYQQGHLDGELIPLGGILASAYKISRKKQVILYCKSGKRSAKAVRWLEQEFEFENLYSLEGGIKAYADEFNPQLLED